MSIRRLLKKEYWTGREAGQIYMAYFVDNNSKEKLYPELTREKVDAIIGSLFSPRQREAFRPYKYIHDSYEEYRMTLETYVQTFFHAYQKLMRRLDKLQLAENVRKSTTEYPLILTAAQYKNFSEYIEKDKRNRKQDFVTLLFEYISNAINEKITTPAHIREMLEQYDKEPAQGPLLKTCFDSLCSCEYVLQDGTSSLNCTREEWDKIKKDLEYKKALEVFPELETLSPKITRRDKKKVINTYWEYLKIRIAEAGIKGETAALKLFKDINGAELSESGLNMSAGEWTDFINNFAIPFEGTYILFRKAGVISIRDKFIGNDVTKGDLLDAIATKYTTFNTPTKDLEGMEETFPGLLKAISKVIINAMDTDKGQTTLDLFEAAAPIERLGEKEIKDLEQVYFSWGQLADLNILSYRDKVKATKKEIIALFVEQEAIQADSENFTQAQQRKYNGIAIIKEKASNTPKLICGQQPLNPYYFLDSIDNIADQARIIKLDYEQLLKIGLVNIIPFHRLIEMLEEVYKIKGLSKIKNALWLISKYANDYNRKLARYYNSLYEGDDRQEEKRQLLKKHLRFINLEDYEPRPQRLAQLKEMLKNREPEAIEQLRSFVHLVYSIQP
jgi:hypothetical protein